MATFNGKMVAIKKIQLPKTKKKREGEDTSWRITRMPNALNGKFSTLDFAAVSVRIHVEFQNDERGKEKDRHWTGVAATCNID